MTRQWISEKNHDWVMVCDQPGCPTTSEPFPTSPPLELFQKRGWFTAKLFGDICPACLAKGVQPKGEPFRARKKAEVDA
ncbi:hypothetical protein [Nocardia abscessus]|uniref:hypothetical protein n=1 Tax=Nocardia abscessus TaxID=120957 RepID=UPI000311EBA6|nr:hypothetical protein [Nocardia abscessus]MCC3333559.1 hypothetical protein [Nocardia abscessus]